MPESVIYLIIEIIIPSNVKEKENRKKKEKKRENLLPGHIVGKLQARLLDYLTSKFRRKVPLRSYFMIYLFVF